MSTDASPSASPSTLTSGAAISCDTIQIGFTEIPESAAPVAYAGELLEKAVSATVDPTQLGWQGGEFLYLYRPGQASRVMADIISAADRCSGKPVNDGSGGIAVPFREYPSRLSGMGDEAVEVNVHSPVFHFPASMAGLFTAGNWIVIRSGNVLLVTEEMGNISRLDKYLTAATSTAWRLYEKGA